MESKTRSLLKAVSWRCLGTFVTTTLVYFITGKVKAAATVGILDTLIKIIGFYVHERFWLKISYGKKGAEYEI